jgi:hypothetical protein
MGAGVWSAWSAPGLSVVPLCAAVVVYLRGWNRLRRVEPWRWSVVRPVCFVAGVALIGVALVFLSLFLFVPLVSVFFEAFKKGWEVYVAAITEAAMRGEITDFRESLRRRLALLQGVTLADMERVYTDRLQINPGAAELIAACQKVGLKVLLVSGGFTFFANRGLVTCEDLQKRTIRYLDFTIWSIVIHRSV